MSEILTTPLIKVLIGCFFVFTLVTVFAREFLLTRKRYLYFFLTATVFIIFQILVSSLYALGVSVTFIFSMMALFAALSLCIIYFLRKKVSEVIKNTETHPLRSIPQGFAETYGNVVMINSSAKVLHYSDLDEGAPKRDLTVGAVPFMLESDGKRVFVEIRGAQLFFQYKKWRYNVRDRKMPGGGPGYYFYQMVREGDRLYCIGTVEKYKNDNVLIEKLYEKNNKIKEKPEFIIKKGIHNSLFVISDMEEDELLKKISDNNEKLLTVASFIAVFAIIFYLFNVKMDLPMAETLFLSWAFLIPSLTGIYYYLVKYY